MSTAVNAVWSWRLSDATPAQRCNYEIIGDGKEFIGPKLTKISASMACYTAFLHDVPGRSSRRAGR